MVEVRCKQCGKLLGYIEGKYQIKCTGLYHGKKCGFINSGDTRIRGKDK